MTTKRLYFLYHFKSIVVETFKDLPFMLNRKEFHSFDDIKEMIEKMIKIKFPGNLFTDDPNVNKIKAKFDVKNSPNSRKIKEHINRPSSHSLQDFGTYFF